MRRIDSCGHKAWTSSDPAEFKGRSKASNFGELRDGLISGKFWERRRWQPVEAPPGNIMSGGEPRCSARFAGAHSPGGSRSIATASSMCSGPSVPSMVGTSEADYARTQRQSRPSGSPSEAARRALVARLSSQETPSAVEESRDVTPTAAIAGPHISPRRGITMARHRCCTANLRALWATCLLNTVFTMCQVAGVRLLLMHWQ